MGLLGVASITYPDIRVSVTLAKFADFLHPSYHLVHILRACFPVTDLWRPWTGDKDSLAQQLSESVLHGYPQRIPLAYAEHYVKYAVFRPEVIEDNIIVSVVPVPPLQFTRRRPPGIGRHVIGCERLSAPRGAPKPVDFWCPFSRLLLVLEHTFCPSDGLEGSCCVTYFFHCAAGVDHTSYFFDVSPSTTYWYVAEFT